MKFKAEAFGGIKITFEDNTGVVLKFDNAIVNEIPGIMSLTDAEKQAHALTAGQVCVAHLGWDQHKNRIVLFERNEEETKITHTVEVQKFDFKTGAPLDVTYRPSACNLLRDLLEAKLQEVDGEVSQGLKLALDMLDDIEPTTFDKMGPSSYVEIEEKDKKILMPGVDDMPNPQPIEEEENNDSSGLILP